MSLLPNNVLDNSTNYGSQCEFLVSRCSIGIGDWLVEVMSTIAMESHGTSAPFDLFHRHFHAQFLQKHLAPTCRSL